MTAPSPSRARVTLALAVLALAGCGGGGGADTLSKSELIARGDAICRDVKAQSEKLAKPKTMKDVERLGARAAAITERGTARMRELNPPPAAKADFDRLVALAGQEAGDVRAMAPAARANDLPKVRQAIARAQAVDRRFNQTAHRIGFKECGRD
jgi:hypothetical protein